LAQRIFNDGLETAALEQVIQSLDRERLQRPILVERQLAQRSVAGIVYPDQQD
jgi:hypothetical protein